MVSHLLVSYYKPLKWPPRLSVICSSPRSSFLLLIFFSFSCSRPLGQVHAIPSASIMLLTSLLVQASFTPDSVLKSHLTPPVLRKTFPSPTTLITPNCDNPNLVQIAAKPKVSFRLNSGQKKSLDLIISLLLGPISLALAPRRCSTFMVFRWLQLLQLPHSPSNPVGRGDRLLQVDSKQCPRNSVLWAWLLDARQLPILNQSLSLWQCNALIG